MRAQLTNSKGFTLLEIIIAVGLSALLLLTVYSTYFGINKAIDAASEGQEVLETGRILMELQRQDLRGAITSASRPPFVCDVQEVDGEPHYTIEFATTSLMGENPFGLGKVGYELIKMANGEKILIRRELKNVKDDLVKIGSVFELSKMVTTFELSFFDGTEWKEKWDSKKVNKLPKQVRIAFTVADNRGYTKKFVTVEAIPGAL